MSTTTTLTAIETSSVTPAARAPPGQPDIAYAPDRRKWEARTARRLAEGNLRTTLPQGFPQQLQGDLVWDGANLAESYDWTYVLNTEQLSEIDAAVKHFKCELLDPPHKTRLSPDQMHLTRSQLSTFRSATSRRPHFHYPSYTPSSDVSPTSYTTGTASSSCAASSPIYTPAKTTSSSTRASHHTLPTSADGRTKSTMENPPTSSSHTLKTSRVPATSSGAPHTRRTGRSSTPTLGTL